MVNKKGVSALMILIAIAFFMFAMIFMNFIMDEVTTVRGTTGLNCTTPSSDGDKVVCLVVDATIPLYIIAILGVVAIYVAARYMK